jgi:hypothetical protein
MSAAPIYVIRTPLRQVAQMTYGGPMRIKVGRRRVAYAGFATRDLAEAVTRYWNLPSDHHIEPWEEALRHETPGSRAKQLLLFRDESDFRAWLESPATFDVEAHVVSLHFAGLGRAEKRSA